MLFLSRRCARFIQNLLGGGDDDDDDDDDEDNDDDDGSFDDDHELQRKLSRLSGPGGALESDSRQSPHLFAPGGALASTVAAARESPDSADLERRAAEGVVDLSEIFSDVKGYSSDRRPRSAADMLRASREADETRGKLKNGADDDDNDDMEDSVSGDGDEWGSFDEDDWGGKIDGGQEEARTARGAEAGEEVPGLLGGKRFSQSDEEEGGDEEEIRADKVAEGRRPAAPR